MAIDLLTAIVKAADHLALDPSPRRFLGSGLIGRLDLLSWHLARQLDEDTFRNRLPELVESGESLFLVTRLVATLSMEHGRIENGRSRMHEPAAPLDLVERLEELLKARLQTMADTDRLLGLPQLQSILYRWRDFGGGEAASAWAQRTVAKSDEALLTMLHSFEGETITSAGYRQTRTRTCDPANLEPFVPATSIIDRVRSMAESDETAAAYARDFDIRASGGNPMDLP